MRGLCLYKAGEIWRKRHCIQDLGASSREMEFLSKRKAGLRRGKTKMNAQGQQVFETNLCDGGLSSVAIGEMHMWVRDFLYSPKEFKLNPSTKLRISRLFEQKYLVDRSSGARLGLL